MADDTPTPTQMQKSYQCDHDRLLIIEEQLRNISSKAYDLRKLTSDMSDIKDAVVRLTILQEKLQDESEKRDKQFLEYSASAERQWKKAVQSDIAFERLSATVDNLNENFKEYKKTEANRQLTEEERVKLDKQNAHDLRKTKINARWAIVTAVVTGILSLIGVILTAVL